MFISDFAIRRPIITIVTMIALVVFGLASLFRLETDEFPELDQPIVFIGVAYPGAAPDVVEREVVSRLEDKISGISGVDKLNSTSTDGFAQIVVQFVFSKDVNQATQDVRDAISAVRAQLPQEILEPVIARFDPNTLPIVSLALTSSSLTTPELTQLADQQIADELRAIAGVAQVNVVGGDSAQLNINVKPAALAATGVGIVAKNAILLIDFAKWAHTREGIPLREALIEAGRIRLRPIMMTTLALIAGMVPVALGYGEGADFRAPLGRAVIGGVVASTVLTLVVIPTVYEIMEEWRSGLLRRFGLRAHGAPGLVPAGADAHADD